MSWDVSLEIDTGAGSYAEIEIRNITYNNSCVMFPLGVGIGDMIGKSAESLVPRMESAVCELKSNAAKYRQVYRDAGMPENWGGVDDILQFLELLLQRCKEHPLMKLSAS